MNEELKQQLALIDEIDPKFKKKISLSIDEVGSVIGVSRSTMDKLRNDGTGPEYRKIGSKYIYPKIKLAEWLLLTIKTV